MTLQHYTITTICDAAKAQLITWDSVIAKQNEQYPACAEHGTPTPAKIDGKPVCEQCVAEHLAYYVERLRGER